jgi:hypothetical protein
MRSLRYRGAFRMPGEFLPILFRPDRLQLCSEGSAWLSNTPAKAGSMFPIQFEPARRPLGAFPAARRRPDSCS